jgi:acyl transferase domain-containing protein
VPSLLIRNQFPIRATPWPATELRRASINSFGFGGTNAHVVIDDAYNFMRSRNIVGHHRSVTQSPKLNDLPVPDPQTSEDEEAASNEELRPNLANGTLAEETATNGVTNDPVHGSIGKCSVDHAHALSSLTNGHFDAESAPHPKVFVFSSQDEDGIKRTGLEFSAYLHETKRIHSDGKYLGNLAYTLSNKRTQFAWKSYAVASSTKELANELQTLSQRSKHIRKSNTINLGFVFTGQGAQWPAMGQGLMMYPVFRESMSAASDFFLRMKSPWNLLGKPS